jgi:biofilm PGA synthesis N-glycosyltransferase PgaC
VSLIYGVVTPVRDERDNLPRLASALTRQTTRPVRWVVVDTASTDDTVEVAATLARAHPWISVLESSGASSADRGWPVVKAIHEGVAAMALYAPDVVVKLDADVSFEPDYFARVLRAFGEDERLAIVGGTCFEYADGRWLERPVSAPHHVWGAARAYRWASLDDVFPLEERMGWDGVDELKAELAGWQTRTIDAPFLHFRPEGERDGARWRPWLNEGDVAHFMGYRPSAVLVRTMHRLRNDPHAVALVAGYVRAALARQPVCASDEARHLLREKQRLRHLPSRLKEARAGAAVSRELRLPAEGFVAPDADHDGGDRELEEEHEHDLREGQHVEEVHPQSERREGRG